MSSPAALYVSAEALPWRSPAAAAYRTRVARTASALRAAADELDAALVLLRRYACTLPARAGDR